MVMMVHYHHCMKLNTKCTGRAAASEHSSKLREYIKSKINFQILPFKLLLVDKCVHKYYKNTRNTQLKDAGEWQSPCEASSGMQNFNFS